MLCDRDRQPANRPETSPDDYATDTTNAVTSCQLQQPHYESLQLDQRQRRRPTSSDDDAANQYIEIIR